MFTPHCCGASEAALTSRNAGFEIRMIRARLPFVMKYYLPCAVIVVVSQISFVIPPESTPARVGLLVTLFLCMTNIFASHQVIK